MSHNKDTQTLFKGYPSPNDSEREEKDMENNIVLFESADQQIKLNVEFDGETVWLTQRQIAELFEKDRTVITRHINNIFNQGELDRESNVHFLHIPSSDRPISVYDLDVVLSVGYRVNSRRVIVPINFTVDSKSAVKIGLPLS